jgi:superfamily II DNA/RNA helicase
MLSLSFRLSHISPEVLIATPERLCDLLSVGAVSISNVSFMVCNISLYDPLFSLEFVN